jgi:hypothetical protein
MQPVYISDLKRFDMDPLLRKLNLDDQTPVLLINAPEEMKLLFADRMVDEHHVAPKKYTFILAFVHTFEQANHLAGELVSVYVPGGCLWVAYPKSTSKRYTSDVSDDALWSAFIPYDFEPVIEVSLKNDWHVIQFRHLDEIKTKVKKTITREKCKEETDERKIESIESVISQGNVLP